MPELIAKANQAILEAQLLRREQRALRHAANTLVSELGKIIVKSHAVEDVLRQTLADLRGGSDNMTSGSDRKAQPSVTGQDLEMPAISPLVPVSSQCVAT